MAGRLSEKVGAAFIMISASIAYLSQNVAASSMDLPTAFAITCLLWFFLDVVFIGYAYKDANRRDMNGLLWAILTFVLPIVGFLLYLAVRNPIPGQEKTKNQPKVILEKEIIEREVVKVKCPYCGALIDQGLDKCPHCGAPLR